MHGTTVILFVAIFAMNGLSGNSQAVKVAPGPFTYQPEKALPSQAAVFEINSKAAKNITELLPANDFSVGNLTRNSLVISS